MAKLSLPEIQDLAASGDYEGTFALSGESAALLLCWLTCLREWDWSGSGDALTPDELEEIDEMVGGLFGDAMTPVEANGMLIGAVLPYAGADLPDNYLWCDGTTYEKGDYEDLYNALHENFHIDSWYFKVPLLQGKFPLGAGGIIGYSWVVGEIGGSPVHTLTESEMPEHTHGIRVTGALSDPPENMYRKPYRNTYWVTQESLPTGGSEEHNNMPPFQAVQYIIYAGA